MARVAVIGCGRIGVKIAGELALNGHHVALHDSFKARLDLAKESIEYDKIQLMKDGLPKFLLRRGTILYMDSLELAVRKVDIVFEAVGEDANVKKVVFKDISAHCPETCIICSGTMSLDLDVVMEFVERPERTIGVRFLYPVLCIPEVEVTRNSFSSQDATARVMEFLSDMGKQVITRCKDPFLLSKEEADDRRTNFIREMKLKHSPRVGLEDSCFGPLLSSASSSSSSSSLSRFTLNLTAPASPAISGRGFSEGSSSPYSRECAICMDAERDTLLCPCRHLITCSSCSWSLIMNQEACPICRSQIKEILHVFHS